MFGNNFGNIFPQMVPEQSSRNNWEDLVNWRGYEERSNGMNFYPSSEPQLFGGFGGLPVLPQAQAQADFSVGLEPLFPEAAPQPRHFLQQEQPAWETPGLTEFPQLPLEASEPQQPFQASWTGQQPPYQPQFLPQEQYYGGFPQQPSQSWEQQTAFPFHQEQLPVAGRSQIAHHSPGQEHLLWEVPQQPSQDFNHGLLQTSQAPPFPLQQGHLSFAGQVQPTESQQPLEPQAVGTKDGLPVFRGIGKDTTGLVSVKPAPQARRKASKAPKKSNDGGDRCRRKLVRSVPRSRGSQPRISASLRSITKEVSKKKELVAFVERNVSRTLEALKVGLHTHGPTWALRRHPAQAEEETPMLDWEFASMADQIRFAAAGNSYDAYLEGESGLGTTDDEGAS